MGVQPAYRLLSIGRRFGRANAYLIRVLLGQRLRLPATLITKITVICTESQRPAAS
jgi:hypothetical protein